MKNGDLKMKNKNKILLNSRKLNEKNINSVYDEMKIETVGDLFKGIYLLLDVLQSELAVKVAECDLFEMIYEKNNKD